MQHLVSASPQELIRQAGEMQRAGQTLLDAAEKMRAAADVLAGLRSGPSDNGAAGQLRTPGRRAKAAAGQTRLEQLIDFVRDNGPISRRDAKAKSGIPPGTVGALLTSKYFDYDKDGKTWTVKDEKTP
ncbi:MAG: hypothetical protein ABSF26_21300 [Thermoguttaceae bacterium]|jgi:hypothetical protein